MVKCKTEKKKEKDLWDNKDLWFILRGISRMEESALISKESADRVTDWIKQMPEPQPA